MVPLLLVLLTLVPQAVLAGEWYRCRFSGVTRSDCCCSEREHRTEPPERELRGTSCCDVLRNDPSSVSARNESRAALRAPAAQVQDVIAAPRPRVAVAVTKIELERAVSGRGPPLILLKQSFLI